MDFNTGGSGGQNPNDPSRPLFGGESTRSSPSSAGGPGGGPTGGPGGEFTLSDPVGSFVSTARNVLLNPVGYFRGIARRGDIVNPAIFALICYMVFAVLGGLIGLVLGSVTDSLLGTQQDGVGAASSVGGFLLGLILAPFVAAIILIVVAAVRHLLVLLVVGSGNAGFEATLRVSSYTFATRLFWWVPVIGPIVGFLYGLFLSVMGIREVHATSTGKAALVVLIPVAVAFVLFFIAALLFGALVFTLLQQQT